MDRTTGTSGERTISETAQDLVTSAGKAEVTVATAESLTAGQIAATIATVPGASAVLRGGLIVYATELKHTLAGISADLLEHEGPVHPDVAAQLAAGAARVCGADIGVGVTGVAGPDNQDGHPVGEVYIAVWDARDGGTQVSLLDDGWRSWCGGQDDRSDVRGAIRDHTTVQALVMLRQAVEKPAHTG